MTAQDTEEAEESVEVVCGVKVRVEDRRVDFKEKPHEHTSRGGAARGIARKLSFSVASPPAPIPCMFRALDPVTACSQTWETDSCYPTR